MKKDFNFEILSTFVNVIFMDVATKYLVKLKEENIPPKLIKEYLDKSIYLLEKYENIDIIKMRNTINDISKKQQEKFNKLFEAYKDYAELCRELNFAYLLMIDENLQEKAINLISNNIYEYKYLFSSEKIITKKQVDIDKVMEFSKVNKNKLHSYKNNTYEQATAR